MRFLFLDTCTERGLIAYGTGEQCLLERQLPFGNSQSKWLMPLLKEALRPFGLPPPLDAIGAAVGPGSYTGIRLGVAVAQALAYAWQLPLIGIPSLEGFIPEEPCPHFAVLLDARIGGLYLQKGNYDSQGAIHRPPPQLVPLEEARHHLRPDARLVTPNAKNLRAKLEALYPDAHWQWEERPPSASTALKKVEELYRQGQWKTAPEPLELLYLRETEAERTKFRSTL